MPNLIKRPSILRVGYRYEIKKVNSVRYKYAEPLAGDDGKKRGECWIVDIMGNLDDKIKSNPVIFLAKELRNGMIPEEKECSPAMSIVIGENREEDDGNSNGDREKDKKNKRSIRRKQRLS